MTFYRVTLTRQVTRTERAIVQRVEANDTFEAFTLARERHVVWKTVVPESAGQVEDETCQALPNITDGRSVVMGKQQKEAVSAAMKKSALARKCPSCQKANAMRQPRPSEAGTCSAVCRWCGFQKALMPVFEEEGTNA